MPAGGTVPIFALLARAVIDAAGQKCHISVTLRWHCATEAVAQIQPVHPFSDDELLTFAGLAWIIIAQLAHGRLSLAWNALCSRYRRPH